MEWISTFFAGVAIFAASVFGGMTKQESVPPNTSIPVATSSVPVRVSSPVQTQSAAQSASTQATSSLIKTVKPAPVTVPNPNLVQSNTASSSVATMTSGVVVGYTYESKPGSPRFASITLPTLPGNPSHSKDQPYRVYIGSNGSYEFYKDVLPLVETQFPKGGVEDFKIEGINPGTSMCPPGFWLMGATFTTAGQAEFEKKPILSTTVFKECKIK